MQPFPEQFTKSPEVRGGERRQRARHSPSALTYVTLGDSNGGIIANISETGMYVTAGEPLREDFLSRVSFRVPQSDTAIETKGEVVWTSESKKEAGVRFVELREESRDLIRKWVAPARRNGNPITRPAENSRDDEKRAAVTPAPAPANESASAAAAVKSNGGAADVAPRESIRGITPEPDVPHEAPPIPNAVARGLAVSEKDAAPLLAFTGYGTRAWALTEAQRAEFERLFPSENASSAARDSAEPEVAGAAKPEPIADRFASYASTAFVASSAETLREDFAVAPTETAPAPAPVVEPETTIEREAAEAPPAANVVPAEALPRTPMQSLWDAPPPMMQPIIGRSYGRGFGSTYGAPAAEPLEGRRPRSTWSVAAVTILVVAGCFVLGFIVGPDGVRARPKVDAARGVVVGELSHLKSVLTNSGAATPNTATAPAVSPNAAPSSENASASASPTPTAPTAPATGAPTLGEPAQAAPAVPAPGATAPAAEDSAPDKDDSGANAAATDSDGTRDGADAAPAVGPARKRTENVPTATAKKRDLERAEAETLRAAREAQIEKERAAAEAYAAERAAASAQPTKPAVTTEPATPATSNPSRTEAPNTPLAHPAETAPHSAVASARPQSYFPVVAPGAGNVPRLIELPEERVIDTAAVVIHSHQYVFVPAEPGPESSHALEKLRIGDRVTKMAPMYPAEAAQKAMGGTVHLRAIIGKDGRVEDVRPINGPLALITAAADAIRQWQYRPTLLDQQPIEMQEDFTVEFRPLGLR
jgi:TonB family protein